MRKEISKPFKRSVAKWISNISAGCDLGWDTAILERTKGNSRTRVCETEVYPVTEYLEIILETRQREMAFVWTQHRHCRVNRFGERNRWRCEWVFLWIEGTYNRVRGSFSLPLPTTPCKRVRTGHFVKATGPWPGNNEFESCVLMTCCIFTPLFRFIVNANSLRH